MALREKRMAGDEWPAFQQVYIGLHQNLGSPLNMALFSRHDPENLGAEIMLLAGQTAEAEALSPGGWQDADQPQLHTWALLMGHNSAPGDFGLELGF